MKVENYSPPKITHMELKKKAFVTGELVVASRLFHLP